ncbi:MAG TPA: 30S ribosomal protein S17, partial [Candidatus Luteimonas excrementigallinarum]|nr:30S ribosomal protein S17 [Candidatus Luteimonas excrementigallinarum]
KLHAHDADNSCNEGDTVRVVEIAPMSKTKNWRVVEIVSRAAE